MTRQRRRRTKFLALIVAFAAAAAAASAIYFGGFTGNPQQNTAQILALGADLYGANCAACHGVNREGQENWQKAGPDGLLPAPPHDETGHTWHHPDQQLFQIIKSGTAALVGGDYKTSMIGFGDRLGDDEIRAILEYIKSNWPEPIRQRQAEVTARAGQGQ